MYLENHGIPLERIDHVFSESKRFFDRPLADKTKLAWKTPEANRGYVAPGRERVSLFQEQAMVAELRLKSPDLKESMEIGNERNTTYTNNWPEGDDAFRTTMTEFFDECASLSRSVMAAIAIGLKLRHDFFDQFIDKADNNLRLLHYPSTEVSTLDREGQSRAGAHTDYGTVTLLFQDNQGGLEVKNLNGDFVPAKPIRGSIVVNAGDLLARWSNDIIKSTEHRVVSPPIKPNDSLYPARYSIAYFGNPNPAAEIACLDGCWSAKTPKKYEAVNAHAYLTSRLAATY